MVSRLIQRIDVPDTISAHAQAGDPDDTLAFTRAIAAGDPIYLGDKTYSVSNIIASSSVASVIIIGVPGRTVIQKSAANGSAFANIASPHVVLEGIIFDLNYSNFPADQWGVLVASSVAQDVTVRKCVFKNHGGSLGAGFAHRGTNPLVSGKFVFEDNEVTNCTWNGTYFGSVSNGRISRNYIHDMAGSGITVSSYLSASSTNYSSDITISDNIVHRTTGTGIGAGGIASPYVYGTPSAIDVVIRGNLLEDCGGYSITGQGDNISTIGNTITNTSGYTSIVHAIQYTGRYGCIGQNTANLSEGGGIDMGGCQHIDVLGNTFSYTTDSGINCGGSTGCLVSKNILIGSGSSVGISILEMEGDGQGGIFPYYCSGLVVEGNTITVDGGSAKGVQTYDNPGGRSTAKPTIIRGNSFLTKNGASGANAISLMSGGSSTRLSGNTVDGSNFHFYNGLDMIVYDAYDAVYSSSGAGVDIRSVQSPLLNDYGSGDKVLWAYPTAGGSGYTAATTLSASGGSGTGWTGRALISQGVIMGVQTLTRGSGYSGTVTISASDSGGGSGATFSATRAPSITHEREVTISTTSVTHVVATGGGNVGIHMPAPVLMAPLSVMKLKWLSSASNKWTVLSKPDPVYAVGSLPTPAANMNGAEVGVTGSTTSKWRARCDGSNWIWPDGSTVTT